VSPNTIGGRRMASEAIRPTVVEFLDLMLRDRERNLRFAEVTIPAASRYVGKLLRELPTHHETNTLIVARRPPNQPLEYNPKLDAVIEADTVVVVLGKADDVVKLRELVERA
jgi:voltage-gated potassium channel